ncbi:chromate transporter [Zhaonella formicivorans]|uniref:chromate transporter n=1 Tax=Zhaonella formicivorans TaxID=2528593 RepID=UPI0010DF38C4|nr:chromate transporter [Zhaonella formicivorans]
MLLKMFMSFLKIGAFSFGGGYAMVALIQKEVVEKHQWLSNGQLIDILAISQMTPGPIAVNSATYVGYKVGGLAGAIAATSGVVLPSFIFILGIAALLKRFTQSGLVEGIFKGIRPVVVALILSAAWLLLPSSFTALSNWLLFGGVLLGLYVWKMDPIILLLASGMAGIIIYS